MQEKKRNALIWLRNDLRINDHYGFYKASKECDQIFAYYTFDKRHFKENHWGFKKSGKFRAKFLLESLRELQKELSTNNITLIIDQNCASEGIPRWIEKLLVTDLYYQNEWTTEERIVSVRLKKNLSEEIKIHSYYDQFLFHPDNIPFEIKNLPEIFTVFRKKCEKYCSVKPCLPKIRCFPAENKMLQNFEIPLLTDLGFTNFETHPNSAFPFEGGSNSGMQRIQYYFWETNKLPFYKQTRNGLVGIDYSSKLSSWLSLGALSAREIYWQVKKYENEFKKNQSTYWLIFELIWRDYFKYISLKHGDKIFQIEGILNKKYNWDNKIEKIDSWINGTTNEPFVNANMIELSKTGWMSNRGRQNVASYFSKNLLTDWRIGAAYFESQLIDYDVHSNYGNWMYVSGVGNDPRDRKFDVSWQAQKYDSQKKFQNLWIK
tara:strand:- start:1122 stop:2420 length:1299 start_codon:yes stop_codon:yes gene_type:complete